MVLEHRMNTQAMTAEAQQTPQVAAEVPRSHSRISVDAVAFAVIASCHAPLLLAHFRRLWLYEQYHYVPFVIAAFAYFVWQRWDKSQLMHSAAVPRTSLALLVTGLLTLTLSLLVWSSWLAAIAAILTIGAALLHFGGRRMVSQLFSVWLLLWFLVPLPFRWDVRLIFELQTIASSMASYALDFLLVDHLLAGHVLEIPRHKFLVEEACSGIHSLFALLAFAAMLMIGSRRGWVHSILLLATAVFWATSINVVRVTSVVAFFVWFDFDVATGWKHTLLGLSLFGVAILMLLSMDRLLLFFFGRPDKTHSFYGDYYDDAEPIQTVTDSVSDRSPEGSASSSDSSNVASDRSGGMNWRKGTPAVMVCCGLFGLVGLGQIAGVAMRFDALRVVGEANGKLNNAFQEGTLPAHIESWKRVTFKSEEREMTNSLGASFASWTYQSDTTEATVTINYPFVGWHHLPACYEAQGWQVESTKMIAVASESEPDVEVWLLALGRPSGARMYVRFSQFDADGQPVRPAGWQLTSLRRALRHNPFGRRRAVSSDTSTYQVVMQVVTLNQSSAPSPEALTENFLLARKNLVETITQRLHNDR